MFIYTLGITYCTCKVDDCLQRFSPNIESIVLSSFYFQGSNVKVGIHIVPSRDKCRISIHMTSYLHNSILIETHFFFMFYYYQGSNLIAVIDIVILEG